MECRYPKWTSTGYYEIRDKNVNKHCQGDMRYTKNALWTGDNNLNLTDESQSSLFLSLSFSLSVSLSLSSSPSLDQRSKQLVLHQMHNIYILGHINYIGTNFNLVTDLHN